MTTAFTVESAANGSTVFSVDSSGDTLQTGNQVVQGSSSVTGSFTVTGTQTFTGNQTVTGNETVGGTLTVTGASTFTGLVNLNGGTDTAASAPVLTTSFANGTAAQLSDLTRDYVVYLNVTTAGTATTLAIGPTSTPANTVKSSTTATIGDVYTVRLPAGWYLKWAGTTTAIATQIAIGC